MTRPAARRALGPLAVGLLALAPAAGAAEPAPSLTEIAARLGAAEAASPAGAGTMSPPGYTAAAAPAQAPPDSSGAGAGTHAAGAPGSPRQVGPAPAEPQTVRSPAGLAAYARALLEAARDRAERAPEAR